MSRAEGGVTMAFPLFCLDEAGSWLRSTQCAWGSSGADLVGMKMGMKMGLPVVTPATVL